MVAQTTGPRISTLHLDDASNRRTQDAAAHLEVRAVRGSVIVLGSGQDAGVPQIGMSPDPPTERTAASIAVLDGSGGAVLVDASPDLRVQQRRLRRRSDYAARTARNPFDGVVLTHAHMGHYLGLAHFGKEAAATDRLPLWATAAMLGFLEKHEPWASLFSGEHVVGRVVTPGVEFRPLPDVTMTAVSVPHRAEFTDTVAYSIVDETSGHRTLYLPDIDSWDLWGDAGAAVAAHDTVLLDATFYDTTEQLDRPMESIPHPPVVDTIERFGHLATGNRRIVLTHLNRTNPLNDPGSEAAVRVARAGFEVARDDLELIA